MTVRRFWTCWFCKKTLNKVEILIAGPSDICICNECIDVCNEIVNESKVKATKRKQKRKL